MTRPARIAIGGSGAVLVALVALRAVLDFTPAVGVPRSLRIGTLDPTDARPQLFPFHKPLKVVGFTLVSSEPGGDSLQIPSGVPESVGVRILGGDSSELTARTVPRASFEPTNWHAPRRSCLLLHSVVFAAGASYTLEITPLVPARVGGRLHVFLESIDYGV